MKMSLGHITSSVVINALRFTLALVFAFSGFVKAIDPMGTVYKMADYADAFGMSVGHDWLFGGAMLLIMAEYLMGMCLFFGLYRRTYLTLIIAFLLVMTPLTLNSALYNPVSDCGCFGDAVVLTNWQTFGKNVVLLLMAIIVLLGRRYMWRVISERTQWLVFVYVGASIMAFILYNLRHLPVVDFRPYHVGANIIESMSVPEGVPQDEYETLFVLEKDGEQRTFTLDNYPDSTWTFVERHNRLIQKGYVPQITDFQLTDRQGEDCTWEVLEHPGYTFLMVAYDLKRTDEGMLDVINDLYDYADMHNVPFYMLTSSGNDDIEEWNDHTGAIYPFLLADEVQLKTMVRDTPGLILLKDATVVGKWSRRDMPHDELLVESMESNAAWQMMSARQQRRKVNVVLWMFVPLMLLVGVDKCMKKNVTNQ